jgi:hypothetical protein
MTKKLEDFERTHGQSKILRLQKDIETERKKVEALAGKQNQINIEKRDDYRLHFALIGDLHIGSLYAHDEALKAFFNYCADAGITDCFCAGDILDGHRIYRGQEFELRDVGLDKQLDRLDALQLNDAIKMQFITGNHDQSFKHLCGVNVGEMIAQIKPAWKFLGEDQAVVKYETPAGDYDIMLLHPSGGSAYALSYKPQKIAEQLEGGTKPNALIIGHFHKAEFLPSYRNISIFQAGTFQRQTPFMARGGLAAHMGGWIVTVDVGDGYNNISAEFIAFY